MTRIHHNGLTALVLTAAIALPALARANDAWVIGSTALRRAPTDDKRIEDPEGKKDKPVPNFVTLLDRGAAVSYAGSAPKEDDAWVEVVLSGGQQGFIKVDKILPADEWKPRAVVEDTRRFTRPTYVALEADRISGGGLLFVGEGLGDFIAVDWPASQYGSRQSWALKSELPEPSEAEAEAAVMLTRILNLKDQKDVQWKELAKLANEQWPDSAVLKAHLPDPDAPEGEGEGEAPAE